MGEAADGDVVDTGAGVIAGYVEGEAAGAFQFGLRGASVAALHRHLGGPGFEVVEQDELRFQFQHLVELREESTSTSTGMSGAAARTALRAALTEPAAATWLS